ncbi:type II asparaginase [Paenibacillus ottowii]|uniref:asparaginase n=1 Tax=Paenibacillus ottowii TaxID=2315729 RepID=A0ABY3BEW5_9BACL|nr:type II asparaginase [Paenibacillus ottowii]NEU27521.1 type II asparaginase [Paenibacillus polymyxa]TQS00779.1 type II asparaginase [Paenibacillus ottowii]
MTNMKKMTMIPLLASFILGSTLWSGGFTANAATAATTSTTVSTVTPTTTPDKQTNHLPNIKILATGGTIAGSSSVNTDTTGYKAGALGVETLINAVPEMKSIANVSGEQVVNVGSPDVNNEILLKLAKRTNELLARDDVDGIVITHGTDTLEETAYFLNLVVKSDKPVVVVGSMRPATAISADGPFNLYNAVKVAGAPTSKGQGVLVLLNDRIGAARYITKTNTTAVDTFKSVEQGYLGAVVGDQVYYYNKSTHKHTTSSVFDISNLTQLPQVDILYEYQNNGRYLYDAAVAAGAKGIVVAGSGNGSLSKTSSEGAEAAGKKGVIIARSTRVGSGVVSPSTTDAASNFVSTDSLNPQKARILLMLALTQTHDVNQIQTFFNEY